MATIDDGLDIDNIDVTTQEEIDTYLSRMWRHRGLLYELSANSIWLDTRPDITKLHRWGARLFGRPEPYNVLTMGIANLHTYIHLGWEPGIHNEFRVLQRQGLTKEQLFEVVMLAQLTAGIRGLELVYRAVGTIIVDWQDRPIAPAWPAGWGPDPAAFQSGLDLSTRELTDADVNALTGWYERTIGEVPRSVTFAIKYHPKFLKAYRAKWERVFRKMPKQMMPYLMLRHSTWTGNRDGVREAALLGKAWGMTREWVINPVMHTAYYFAGLEGLYHVEAAIGDVLESWE